MVLLNLVAFTVVYVLIKCFRLALASEAAIRQRHHDKVEDQQRNMYM